MDMRPISHELAYIWIAGDGKIFLDEKECREYQNELELEAVFEF